MRDWRLLLQLGALACCPFLLAACVSRHPSGIASASGPVTPTYTVLGPVEDSDCGYWILIVPLGGKAPSHEIIENLVKERGADALVGVTVEERVWAFPLPLFGSHCTVVKGTAVKNSKQ
ncbi:MAG: hypothetical protein AB1411_12355 [Nitrospirota bacterium]